MLAVHPTDVAVRQSIEGGSGIVESIVTEVEHDTADAARESAQAKIRTYCQEAEKFTFDSQSRELVWNVGELMVAQGILNPASNIAFQISFVPYPNQRGQTPVVINEVTVTGQDTWAGEILQARDNEIITALPDDPSISTEKGTVR